MTSCAARLAARSNNFVYLSSALIGLPPSKSRKQVNGHDETSYRDVRSGLLCLVQLRVRTDEQCEPGRNGSDAAGALIPGVAITATHTATGIVTTVFSNEAGAYQFASLQTGAYRVSAELPGFQTQTYSNVALGISQQVRFNFTLQIAASQGRLLLVNPSAGQIGNMGLRWIEGPSRLGLDMNLIKRVRISETKEFEFRLDAVNLLNHPIFGNPNLSINNLNFGRITSATGNRRFVTNLRLSV
jgi:hypothetical protein